ncbi:MAG TPA: Maf family nucleotide pyrophosphatase [Sutterellaceae bacterium]|uniref:Maf family protein n=1 Tax=Parasutterella secunda TaxID=626947 RepID=UPI00033DE048|nr:Maf family protein [Parasutterella secunda]MDM8112989.1 Maf family protein [Parasutterella secunda]CDE77032.1 maf-like protein HMPREF9464_01942 [Sutterella sp. CAG:521]HJI94345.1 Maf family nucleotide pyrophosphatase [Sutterellaceae bacterium]
MLQKKLVLGSSSPYRKELLERLGVPFECVSADIDESRHEGETPEALCVRLAREKALKVKSMVGDAIVIGSDQVAVLGERILGKPHTRERAIEQLSSMQGQTVYFLTALCIIGEKGEIFETMVPTIVTMKKLSVKTIENYLDREQPFNCAGSAKIEKLGIALMKEVRSTDPTALIGLPLIETVNLLAKAGLEIIEGIGEA